MRQGGLGSGGTLKTMVLLLRTRIQRSTVGNLKFVLTRLVQFDLYSIIFYVCNWRQVFSILCVQHQFNLEHPMFGRASVGHLSVETWRGPQMRLGKNKRQTISDATFLEAWLCLCERHPLDMHDTVSHTSNAFDMHDIILAPTHKSEARITQAVSST